MVDNVIVECAHARLSEWLDESFEAPYHVPPRALVPSGRKSLAYLQWHDCLLWQHRNLRRAYQRHRGCSENIADLFSGALSGSDSELRREYGLVTRSQVASLTAQRVLRDLESMLDEEDEPDYRHRPTEYAYNIARQIIEDSYTHYVGSAPIPALATDGEGGIIAEWRSGQRIVRLIVNATQDRRSYVYQRGADQSVIDRSASGSILAQRLRSIFAS